MERHVKERLIGAAVLMAAAIILIPEMLSGPDRTAAPSDGQAKLDAPLKTYTIDLQQQTKPATETVIEERAPPPEEAPPTDHAASAAVAEPPQAIPEPSARAASAPATHAEKPSDPPATPAQKTPPPQPAASSPIADRATPAPATPTAAAKQGRWAVQLGSFSREDTARRLAEEMARAGHDAFVMPVRSGAATLYRVRVGPMNDRASAQEALSALRAKSPGAAVVAHP